MKSDFCASVINEKIGKKEHEKLAYARELLYWWGGRESLQAFRPARLFFGDEIAVEIKQCAVFNW